MPRHPGLRRTLLIAAVGGLLTAVAATTTTGIAFAGAGGDTGPCGYGTRAGSANGSIADCSLPTFAPISWDNAGATSTTPSYYPFDLNWAGENGAGDVGSLYGSYPGDECDYIIPFWVAHDFAAGFAWNTKASAHAWATLTFAPIPVGGPAGKPPIPWAPQSAAERTYVASAYPLGPLVPAADSPAKRYANGGLPNGYTQLGDGLMAPANGESLHGGEDEWVAVMSGIEPPSNETYPISDMTIHAETAGGTIYSQTIYSSGVWTGANTQDAFGGNNPGAVNISYHDPIAAADPAIAPGQSGVVTAPGGEQWTNRSSITFDVQAHASCVTEETPGSDLYFTGAGHQRGTTLGAGDDVAPWDTANPVDDLVIGGNTNPALCYAGMTGTVPADPCQANAYRADSKSNGLFCGQPGGGANAPLIATSCPGHPALYTYAGGDGDANYSVSWPNLLSPGAPGNQVWWLDNASPRETRNDTLVVGAVDTATGYASPAESASSERSSGWSIANQPGDAVPYTTPSGCAAACSRVTFAGTFDAATNNWTVPVTVPLSAAVQGPQSIALEVCDHTGLDLVSYLEGSGSTVYGDTTPGADALSPAQLGVANCHAETASNAVFVDTKGPVVTPNPEPPINYDTALGDGTALLTAVVNDPNSTLALREGIGTAYAGAYVCLSTDSGCSSDPSTDPGATYYALDPQGQSDPAWCATADNWWYQTTTCDLGTWGIETPKMPVGIYHFEMVGQDALGNVGRSGVGTFQIRKTPVSGSGGDTFPT